MNRLHHLRQTLPINIEMMESREDVEFVLLNYGSKDEMHDWCFKNLSKHIITGQLKYLRTKKPTHFVHSHAKNIAHKNAKGDILINLDADNFIVEGYLEFVLNEFAKSNCLVVSPPTDKNGNAGSFGKIAVSANTFYDVGGYEELINLGWAWEDNHFINRVIWHCGIPVIMSNSNFCETIDHSNEERVLNCIGKNMDFNRETTAKMLDSSRKNSDYVANRGKNWGHADDLEITRPGMPGLVGFELD